MEIHVHIHNSDNDKKLYEILEAINKWHERELQVILNSIKAIKKDVKSTPTK